MKDLHGKIAIITGASRGIGRATAEELARNGASVVVNYAENATLANEVIAGIRNAGGKAVAVQADISKLDQIERLFQHALEEFGELDIFVGNAGYASFGSIAEFTETEFDMNFTVNAKGSFFCLQQAARHINEGGRIVCVSTIGTILNGDGGAAYFGSKAAVEQFCRLLAHEVSNRQVTVNLVSPGFTDTDMFDATGGNSAKLSAEIKDLTPLARVGQPHEIAKVICFLVGPNGAWVNRQNLPADGGIISR